MKPQKLQKLVYGYLNGDISEDEFSDLTKEFSANEIREEIKKVLEINYFLSLKYADINPQSAYTDFQKRTHEKSTEPNKVLRLSKKVIFKYAAVFIGLMILSYFFISREDKSINNASSQAEQQITLKVNNSELKIIDSEKSSQIEDENGNIVAIQKGNKLIYNKGFTPKELSYTEINIPYGETFEVQFSDGSIAQLNAGTSMKYPNGFVGETREVFLTGEGYFDVARDEKHPFIVNAGELKVQVLGTEFNVSAYDGSKKINTVLVSGSVSLSQSTNSESSDTVTLTPGELATWNKKTNNYAVQNVNTNDYTAWREGKLIFKNEAFKEIQKKLERHYNVSIINHNKALANNTFSAEFDTETITQVMDLFDKNFGINYEINNNEILIYE